MNTSKKIISLLFIYFFISNTAIHAQDGFLGEVKMFGGTFAPRNWAYCEGQLLSINQNQALFSILGTTYGGDGRTTFALPDMRGRVSMGAGNGPGLTSRRIGQRSGAQTTTLSTANMPSHNHVATVTGGNTTANIPLSTDNAIHEIPEVGDVHAVASYTVGISNQKVKSFGPATNTVNGQAVSITTPTVTILPNGNNQAFSIIQPTQVINYIICVQGLFPSRN